jgi:hypothetical protein
MQIDHKLVSTRPLNSMQETKQSAENKSSQSKCMRACIPARSCELPAVLVGTIKHDDYAHLYT